MHSRAIAEQLADKITDLELRRVVTKSLSEHASLTDQVSAFHKLYNMPILRPDQARVDFSHIDRSRLAMRFGLIAEEFLELLEAMDIKGEITYSYLNEEDEYVKADDIVDAIENTEERNIVEVADALGDLKYVIQGFELEVGIPSQPVLSEIQASNMSKLGVDGKPVYRADGKVLKGPFYFKPDIRKVLGAYGMKFGPN
jgi:predicted HAD superfamily Cof-like phosphohydrolase